MKFSFFLFLFLFVLLATALALDIPKYSFGSMQAAKQFNLRAGQEIETKLYFYNIYGNRPTHIRLSVIEKPQNWQVTIEPGVESREYEVSGQKISVDENLVVYLSNASEEQGENTETIEYITSKVGYIGANFVIVRIKVPESEQVGREFNIKINAVAFWLGQASTIALQQERDFEYLVRTITEYYEKPLESDVEIMEKEFVGSSSQSVLSKPYHIISVGVTFILIMAFAVLLIMSRKKQRKRKKPRTARR
jgi:hypothetical protein